MSTESEFEWFEWVAYFEGSASPEQRAAMERWLNGDPERHVLAGRLRILWDARQEPRAVAIDESAVMARVMATVRSGDGRAPRTVNALRVPASAPAWRRPLIAWAAGLALLVAGVATWKTTHPVAPERRYATGVMQRTAVTLPDGSRVTLAPQTTLVVGAGFGTTSRTVTLSGEAYFDVAATSRAPFIVGAGRVQARVLGTAFGVRSYAAEHDVRLSVVTGRISVSRMSHDSSVSNQTPVVLGQGMVARVTDSITTVVQTSPEGAAEYSRWTRDGALVFHNAKVADILAAIGQWYGYEFRADSTITREVLTVTVGTQSREAILSMLKTMLSVSFSFDGKDGRTVTLRPLRTARPDRTPTLPSTNSPWSSQREVGL